MLTIVNVVDKSTPKSWLSCGRKTGSSNAELVANGSNQGGNRAIINILLAPEDKPIIQFSILGWAPNFADADVIYGSPLTLLTLSQLVSDRGWRERAQAGAVPGPEQPVPHAAAVPPPHQDEGGRHAGHGQPRQVGTENVKFSLVLFIRF